MSARGLEAAVRLQSFLPFAAGVTLSDVYMAILESETLARAVIDEFDLREVYGLDTVEETLRKLGSRTDVGPDLNGVIVLKVEDKDPDRAAAIANRYVEGLDRIYRSTRSASARAQRLFLEERVAESRAGLDSLGNRLASIQSDERFTALSGDLAEAAEAAGTLLGRRLALTVQIRMLEEMGVSDAPMRKELETELWALDAEIAVLPEVGLGVGRLLRDLRIQEHLHFVLVEQLETARLEEARDTRAVEVLDWALPPDRHIRPRRGMVSLAALIMGSALAFLWVAYRDRPA